MASSTVDRAYTNLLEHLQRPKPSISLDLVFSSVTYYLSQLALPHPTQLTAFFISSVLWKQPTLEQLKNIINAFRAAAYMKHTEVQRAGKWFLRSPQQQLAEWVNAVLKGTSRGNPQLKFVVLGGIMLGFHDLGHEALRGWEKERVQRQIVLACTEVMEALGDAEDPWKWKKEFSSITGREVMFLYSCYTILPLLEEEKFSALNVQKLARIAECGIERSFMAGRLLSFSAESVRKENNEVVIQSDSPLVKTIQQVLNNQMYQDAAPLAKLLTRCLSTLGNQNSHSALEVYKDIVERMETTNLEVKQYWYDSILSTAISDDDVDDSSKQTATDIWKILKTLLFSQLMVLQTIIACLIYHKQSWFPRHISAATIARTILRSLHSQAFIISQFGGIAAMSDGFKELKRVVYSTLDVIDAELNPDQQMDFISHLLLTLQESHLPRDHPSYQAETAFTLTVVEQLIPNLTDEMIEEKIIPFSTAYLNDTQHRDTFESAHSLILAIFASQFKKQRTESKTDVNGTRPSLADKLAPFYTNCLISNSEDGRLTVEQLRLAFSNLIKTVASGQNDALAWFCINSLLTHINSKPGPFRMPLYLTLVSSMPFVPRTLLLKVLDEVRLGLDNVEPSQGDELRHAIQEEIMNRVDDLDKETVLTWWAGEVVSETKDS